MTFEYETLAEDVESGAFRTRLERELEIGFRQIHESGERLPTPSHYASQIAEIVSRNAEEPLSAELAFEVYQEILEACENARKSVIGKPSS